MPNYKDNIPVYQEITANYLTHLRSEIPLSRWRNRLTGVFYNGQHAPNLFLDTLGLQQSKHAHFIALIDRISKLDRNAEGVLNELLEKLNDEEQLYTFIFDYFLRLQSTITNQDEAYYAAMSSLKHDINRFAKECEIENRIIKIKGEKHYSYEKGTLSEDKTAQKNKDRRWKNVIDRTTKIIALFNIIPESFIVVGGYAKITQIPRWLSIPLKGLAVIGTPYLACKFAQKDLYHFCKEFYHLRMFKVKDPTSGKYVLLKWYQCIILASLTVFCFVAGLCNAALTFTAVSTVLGSMTFIAPVIVLPTTALLAAFVFSLWAAAFFRPMKELTCNINISLEPLKNYYNETIKWKESESFSTYLKRLMLEILSLIPKLLTMIIIFTIALATMYVVGTVGYFVFKDKCADMLQSIGNYFFNECPKLWTLLPSVFPYLKEVVNGPNIAMAYSGIKLVFGMKKIMHLLGELTEAIKRKIWPTEEEKNPANLNPIQEANETTVSSYASIICLVASRAVPITGYYCGAYIEDHVVIPLVPEVAALQIVGGTVTLFAGVTFGEPTVKSMKDPMLPVPLLPKSEGCFGGIAG